MKTQILLDVKQLIEWSKSNKPIKLTDNIYVSFIFPVFEFPKIEEIYFYSTSILWGHKSIKADFVEEAFNKIENGKNKTKVIVILFNSKIDKLKETKAIQIINTTKTFEEILNKDNFQGYFYTNIKEQDYHMFFKVNFGNSNIKYFLARFPNKKFQKDGALPFDGTVNITEITEKSYLSRVDTIQKLSKAKIGSVGDKIVGGGGSFPFDPAR